MKIQPILELKGIRIELTLQEAEKIAEAPAAGAERIQNEVKLLVDLHHSNSEDALIPLATDGPHKRLDGSHPAKDPKPKRVITPSVRIECEYCRGIYAKRGMVMHQRKCDAKLDADELARRSLESQSDASAPHGIGTT